MSIHADGWFAGPSPQKALSEFGSDGKFHDGDFSLKLLELKTTNIICVRAGVSMSLKKVPRRSEAVVITLIGTLSYIWRKVLRDVLILLDMISRTQRYSKQVSEWQSIEVTIRRQRISSWATLHTFVCARTLSDLGSHWSFAYFVFGAIPHE